MAHEPQTDSPYAAARLGITLLLMMIGASGMYVVPVVLPAVQAEFGVDEHSFGYFLTWFGTLSIVMRVFLLGPIVDRLGERGTMRIGCLAVVAGFLLYPLTTNIGVLALGVV